MNELWYQLKMIFEWELLLPIALIMGLIGTSVIGYTYREIDGYLGVYSVFEIYIPLLTAYLISGLIPDDIESGVLEMLITYPPEKWVLLAKKIVAVNLIMIFIFLPVVVFLNIYHETDILRLLYIAFPPAVVLGGVVLLISLVTKNKLSGMVCAGSYWACEIITKGHFTGKYSLYYASYFGEGGCFCINRIGLLIVGFVFGLITLFIFQKMFSVS